MILVDSSVWIDHLRRSDAQLADLLSAGQILTHPFVIGELAMGQLHQRGAILGALHGLPRAVAATDEEVLAMTDRERLHGLGIGWVDAHLLAATRLTQGARLWTRDRRLAALATRLGIASAGEGRR